MSEDDVLFGYRLRLFALAGEMGVRAACRTMGVHHSTYYRWKKRVDRWGLEALRVRERRRPRMPNELGPHLEQRVLARRGGDDLEAVRREHRFHQPQVLRDVIDGEDLGHGFASRYART
jgi:transposase